MSAPATAGLLGAVAAKALLGSDFRVTRLPGAGYDNEDEKLLYRHDTYGIVTRTHFETR